MSEPFIGEIVMFAGNFAPRGWAFCDGQLLPISQHTALFSLVGTIYGGDGRTTFALPNLKGRVPRHPGHGPGLAPITVGQSGGSDVHTLSPQQLPAHAHTFFAESANAVNAGPGGNADRLLGTGANIYVAEASSNPNRQLSPQAIGNTGGGEAINNNDPYQVVNYIIALEGLFPSRS